MSDFWTFVAIISMASSTVFFFLSAWSAMKNRTLLKKRIIFFIASISIFLFSISSISQINQENKEAAAAAAKIEAEKEASGEIRVGKSYTLNKSAIVAAEIEDLVKASECIRQNNSQGIANLIMQKKIFITKEKISVSVAALPFDDKVALIVINEGEHIAEGGATLTSWLSK